MSEWTVVTVLVTLAGLAAVVVKPLLSLNASLTKLIQAVDGLEKNLQALTGKNSHAHERLWQESRRHEEQLTRHETRLTLLEKEET